MARLLPPSKAINDLFPDLSTLSSSHQDAAPRVPTIFLKMFKNSLSSEASPAQSNVDTMLNAKEAAVKVGESTTAFW